MAKNSMKNTSFWSLIRQISAFLKGNQGSTNPLNMNETIADFHQIKTGKPASLHGLPNIHQLPGDRGMGPEMGILPVNTRTIEISGR